MLNDIRLAKSFWILFLHFRLILAVIIQFLTDIRNSEKNYKGMLAGRVTYIKT